MSLKNSGISLIRLFAILLITGMFCSENRAAEAADCNYFQVPGGKRTRSRIAPQGKPLEIHWRRKDYRTGFNIYPAVTDWTRYNALEMELVSDGKPLTFQIRLVNKGMVFLYEIITLNHKGSKRFVFPLRKLKTNTKPVDLSKINILRFCRDDYPDSPDFTLIIRDLKLRKLPESELESFGKFKVFKGETGFRKMPEKTSLFKISNARVRKIAAALPEKPVGFAPNYKDREFWEKDFPPCAGLIAYSSKTLMNKKLKKIGIEVFPEMLTSPKRDKRGERPGYHAWWYGSVYDCFRILSRMTISECKENKGRFVPKIIEAMNVLLEMPTWDIDPLTLQVGLRYLESHSAMIASNLALSAYLLDDKLPADLRAKIAEKVDEWAITPAFKCLAVPSARHRKELLHGTGHGFWYDIANNMNPYFYNYLLQISLISLKSREQRAWIIANAQEAMKRYFSRYTKDGYITEGMGYWFMGLSNAVVVDLAIRKATGGKESVFTGDFPGIKPLNLGSKMTMIPGTLMYPHFGDHGVDGKPGRPGGSSHLVYMICDLIAEKPYYNDFIAGKSFGTYSGILLSADIAYTVAAIDLGKKYPGIITPASPKEDYRGYFGRISPDYKKIMNKADSDSNTFFANDQDCGVLISRDYPGSKQPFALAVKGGHNGEGHGHDDCGSYCIVTGNRITMGDVGVPVYYHATQKKSKQSYAHPVPFPAGKIQTTGGKGYSKVIAFKDGKEVTSITYDLKNAYAVPSLKKLTRTVVHDRKNRRITITDSFEFSKPETFETALTGYAVPEQKGGNTWHINGNKVVFSCKGGTIGFKQEKLDVLMRNYKPVIRLACRFNGKVSAGEISYAITPLKEKK